MSKLVKTVSKPIKTEDEVTRESGKNIHNIQTSKYPTHTAKKCVKTNQNRCQNIQKLCQN